MTEEEWLAATDPTPMLEFLRGKIGERKARLVACGYCRRVWHLLQDERSRSAVEFTERYVDAVPSCVERARIVVDASEAYADASRLWNDTACSVSANETSVEEHLAILCGAAGAAWVATGPTMFDDCVIVAWETAKRVKSCLELTNKATDHDGGQILRDVFSNPFHAVAIEPSWVTSPVLALAQGIYADRDFSTMPILADALQDAGCDNNDILNHCRDAHGVHVRGCWVVDLVLGKS